MPFGATTQLKVLSSEVESDIDCNDVVDPNEVVGKPNPREFLLSKLKKDALCEALRVNSLTAQSSNRLRLESLIEFVKAEQECTL